MPPFAVNEFSTLPASFEEDVASYRAAGADGIGICELKLLEGRETEQLRTFRDSGLRAASCVPAVPSILPLAALPGPESPEERLEAIISGMRRLAPFEPQAFVCLTGAADGEDEDAARQAVVAALRVLGDEAQRLGVPLGVEPMSARFRDGWTLSTTLDDAAELVAEADSPGLGLVFDTWHLCDTHDVAGAIHRHAESIVAVHVSDWREPTRGWCDRALPGDGVADLPALLEALDSAGWRGFYELEVFSDDGTFGDAYEDSLWKEPSAELARRGREAFLEMWRARNASVTASKAR